ncbi:MAG: ACT domain-containing protein [Ignavibacteriae bacterium]|nr:MAG: ACT domain-containing protein [Ignavibacteriota bacterium]
MGQLKLQLLDEKFAISKMAQFAELPSVFAKGEMCFVMRTDEDLTIISPEFMAPDNGQQQIGYRCIRTIGPIPLETTGVLIALVKPLTEAGISVFAVSTFHSDYIFLMEEHLVKATQALQHAGHEFIHEE